MCLNAFQKFESKHNKFHAQLKDEKSIIESTGYYPDIVKTVSQLQETLTIGLIGLKFLG